MSPTPICGPERISVPSSLPLSSAGSRRTHAGLTAEQEQRARTLLGESLVISLHDHPVRFPLRMEETPEYNRTGRQHAAYAGLAASGMTVVFDNMMDGTACVTGNAPWRWDDIVTDLGMRQADLAHQQRRDDDPHGRRHR